MEGTVSGAGTTEGRAVAEGPPQLLSRSLPGGKNPVSVLMEYGQHSGNSIEFIMTGQAGPPHDTRYCPPLPSLNLSFLSGFPKAATLLVARLIAREEQVIGYFCSFCPH